MNTRMVTGLAVVMLAVTAGASGADTVRIPAGTAMRVRLESNVGSDISTAQDEVRGRLAAPVIVDGRTVVPSGSRLTGIVVDAKEAGKVKGRGRISLRFTSLTSARTDDAYRISTRTWTKIAPSGKEKDAATIALPAAGGAIIGGITGGGKGAAVGAAIGGGAGTAVVLSTRGEDVRLGEGHVIIVRLNQAVVIEQ